MTKTRGRWRILGKKPLRAATRRVEVRPAAGRDGVARAGYFFFRLATYGFLGVALEVFFYNLVRGGRQVPFLRLLFQFEWRVDRRLDLDQVWDVPWFTFFGQCSLWMFVVYAVASACIEVLYENFPDFPLATRAVTYGFVIFLWECLAGWLLSWIVKYEIWWYADAGNFLRMTSWYILPLWCFTGLIVEFIYKQLMDPEFVEAIQTASLEPDPQPKA